jgi:ATP-dependent exoDNAse (exonuclease V) beta subunit
MLTNTPESAAETKTLTADFGSAMHDAYQNLLLGNELDLATDYPDTKSKRHLMSFHRWFYAFTPDAKTIQTEHTVASVTHKFAGTLDLAVVKDGKLILVDFKTTSGIYYSHHLQLAAYRQAYEEMYGKKIDAVYILRTGTRHKDGYEFKEVTTPFSDFLSVYNTYLSMNGGKIPDPPEMIEYPKKIKLWEEQHGTKD